MSGPLRGIHVIELSGLAPVPFCGMILADFGASVVRVDKMGYDPLQANADFMNRGKRRIVLDTSQTQGADILKKMCKHADVVIDPFRPGIMEKQKLGPTELMADNKKLIYARISGYGQSGPAAKTAGHDINYLAISGLLSRFGEPDKPRPPVNFAADFAGGGLMCALGIMMALHERHISGLGQIVDNSMTEGAAYTGTFLFDTLSSEYIWPNAEQRAANLLDGGLPVYDTYKTQDGKYIALGAIEPRFHMQLFQKLNLDFDTMSIFSEPEKLRQSLTEVFLTQTRDYWQKYFKDTDACVSPVLSQSEVGQNEQNRARKSFFLDQTGNWQPSPAPKLSRSPAAPNLGLDTPVYGQHTWQILKELGYSDKQIETLVKDKITVQDSNRAGAKL